MEVKKVRTVRTSKAEFDASKKIVETDTELIVPAVLTREAILPFADGKGYRPAKELQDSYWTLEGAWVIPNEHIPTVFVTDKNTICGQVRNVSFCNKINGVIGEIHIFKDKADANFVEQIKQGKARDVSVAYFCEDHLEPGKFADEPYDFVQRNFMFGHVVVGVAEGRCPSPFCGVALDSLLRASHADPEETENYVHVPVRDKDQFVDNSFRTITLSEDEGIKAVIGKLKSDPEGSMKVQKFLFDKSKGWTLEKAEAWVKEYRDSMDAEWTTEYINDLPDSAFAFIEPGGEKDADGKTVPRTKRHLPFRNAQGEIDHDHLVNALARLPQSSLSDAAKAEAKSKLCSAVRSWNREHPDSKIESDVCGVEDACVRLDARAEIERSRRLLSW